MKTFFIFAAVFCFLVLPQGVEAYATTAQRAEAINERTAVYFIQYEFGHGDYDTYLPVKTMRNQEHGSKGHRVGFEVLEEGWDRTNVGTTFAAVVSNVPVVDGMYKIPKGYKTKFTLVVILMTDEDAAKAEYAVRVTDLPFYRGDNREALRLNVSELEDYITEAVELNESNED